MEVIGNIVVRVGHNCSRNWIYEWVGLRGMRGAAMDWYVSGVGSWKFSGWSEV